MKLRIRQSVVPIAWSIAVIFAAVTTAAPQPTPEESDVSLPSAGTTDAGTEVYVGLVPVSVDAPPGEGDLPESVISLSGHDLVLSEGGHNVWLEFRIGNWDPDDSGARLAAWQLRLDASSLETGVQGELTAYTAGGAGTCDTDEDCAALLGPAANCDPGGYYKTRQFGPGYCTYIFVDKNRSDYVYATAALAANPVWDTSQLNVSVANTVLANPPHDPDPFPEHGLYAGTLTLHVPTDARGTFAVTLLPHPETQLVDENSHFIEPLAIRPATITVQTGRCCVNFDSPNAECSDTLMTPGACSQIPGDNRFVPNATCSDEVNPCLDCGALNAPAEPTPETHAAAGNSRYLSFVPAEPGVETALQVTLVESDQFPASVGMTWWVGEPSVYCENGAELNPPCSPVSGVPSSTFLSSGLQCDPHCMDFGSLGEVLHVGDSNIVPGARYEVRAIACVDGTTDRNVCSAPLEVATSRFGDTIANCEECPCAASDGVVDIIDCKAVIDRWLSAPCAPLTARVDLEPATPDRLVNITDVLQCIQLGFLGARDSLSEPQKCEP